MKIYNTMAREKQELVPLEAGKIKMYACGPTVYNYIHIGNARPLCLFDVLRRYLEYRGYAVTFAQNFTDVDDKIIRKANQEGLPAQQVAARYMQECRQDMQGLGVRPPDIAPLATETMPEIIELIASLLQDGFAYAVEGDVYFRTKRYKEYGKLSRQPLDDLVSGARVEPGERKEDPLDFALWKAAKPGEPFWPSPWGSGRPGWHIECSAMVKKHLGDTIDIHCGGQDLVFPHHENEIAQSECCTGKPYVRYWMHNGYINVDNAKMSKSLGNFFTVRDIADKFGYEPIKYLMLQAHYRSPINYSLDVIEQCRAALERLHTCRNNLDYALQNALPGAPSVQFGTALQQRCNQFIAAMDDDLNTADGIAALFDLTKDCNVYFSAPRPAADVQSAIALYDELCDVLGILYTRNTAQETLDHEITRLIEERQQARKDRNFARADEIRDLLTSRGIRLEDTPQGVKYHFTDR
jgi:cysteinyl-tRNA synthetase